MPPPGAELRRRFVDEGEFPYFRLFLADSGALFANIKRGLELTRAPFVIRGGAVSAECLAVAGPRQPPGSGAPWYRGKPVFEFANGRVGYVSFVVTGAVAYMEASVLSDVYQEPYRMRARRSGKPSPQQWWDSRANREAVWATAAEKGTVSPSALRLELYEASKGLAPEASQFCPSLVVALVQFLFGPQAGDPPLRILDPSAGWGDRLLGAMAAGASYLGVDPNANLSPGYRAMIERFGNPKLHRVITAPFESLEFMPSSAAHPALPPEAEQESFDMVLTSPPFFDHEHYDDAPDQSDVKFGTEELWLKGFYDPFLGKACEALKPNGVLCLYVMNVAAVPIADETMRLVRTRPGMRFLGTIGVHTKFKEGPRLRRPPKFFTRPLFVWRKQG